MTAALADFEKAYPNDPAYHFVAIDAHILAEDFGKAREAIAKLEKQVGGDPYLEFLRGNTFMMEGKTEEAKTRLKSAIEREKDLEDPYWSLISISIDEKNFAKTAHWLDRIEALGVELGDLTEVPYYAEFVKSPEYKTWMDGKK